MVTRRPPALWAAAALLALGCQDLLGLTPGQPDPTGGTGGTLTPVGGTGGTSTGGASAGGAGGAGGGCPADCVSTECAQAECTPDGQCVLTPLKPGEVLEPGAPGDCVAELACDDEGHLVESVFTAKDADDGNPCTWDACGGGLSGHLPRRDGTRCAGGVCKAGACVAAVCVGDGVKDGEEAGKDCGGPCLKACATGDTCKVAADCESGFCRSGLCDLPYALAAVDQDDTMARLTFALTPDPDPNKPPAGAWTAVPGAAVFNNLSFGGVAFDVAGEGIAVFLHGNSARWSRWRLPVPPPPEMTSDWEAESLWSMPAGVGATGWIPTFAGTEAGLLVFAQSTNAEHLSLDAASPAGSLFGFVQVAPADPPASASGGLSGAAAVRQGHASYFYAADTQRLVETRLLTSQDGSKPQWSAPETVLDGNYVDGSPAAAALEGGVLVVAGRRTPANGHVLDWAFLADDGRRLTGTILNTDGTPLTFPSPKPLTRRLSLAARAGGAAAGDGSAVLAFRNADGNLEVRLADPDRVAGFAWSGQNVYSSTLPIPNHPVIARGVGGAAAELLWGMKVGATQKLCHDRLSTTGQPPAPQWSGITYPLDAGAAGTLASVAIATP